MNASQIAILKSEIQSDPVAIGYAGKTHEQIADLVNKPQRSVGKTEIDAGVLASSLDAVEFAALSAVNRAYITMLTQSGALTISAALKTDIRAALGSSPKSLARLNSNIARGGSRGEEIDIGFVTPSDVADALRS